MLSVGTRKTATPDEHGKTPCMHLGINSMAGTDVCHTRRRRQNLPQSSCTLFLSLL